MTDEDAIRNTLAAYVAAWHRNDMDAWGALFTKDSDFITNTAVWWKGRDENVAGHKPIDRAGHITMVMTKQADGRWLIRASQNTNRG